MSPLSLLFRIAIPCALSASLVCAQQAFLKHSTFEDQPSLVFANNKLQLTILLEGSTMASLVLADDPAKLSPLWNPARMARELDANTKVKGSGGMGHFVCVDGFGPVSSEERAAGLTGHGEAHIQKFEVLSSARQGGEAAVTLSAKLPITQEVFTRTFRMVDGENVIYVESQLENLLGFDRPVNWAEHATIGSPFLESGATLVDVAGTRSRTRPYTPSSGGQIQHRLTSGQDFTWPLAPGLDGKTIDMRVAPGDPHYLDHSVTLIDPARKLGWVTAIHPGKRLIIGYLFQREDYPFVQFWGHYPPSGKMARGLEFGTQPFDVPRREAISTGTMFDTPTYRWLPAKAKIQTRFLLFYAPLPEGFRKVDDVRLENGELLIEDRGAGKHVTLRASRPL